jgi:hypothetical protein
MSRLLYPSHRAALLYVLAVALSLAVLVSAVAATDTAPAPRSTSGSGALTGTPSSGSDDAGNHWAGLTLATPGAVTGESVTVGVTTPALIFNCPKPAVVNPNFAHNGDWDTQWQHVNLTAGTISVTQATPLCTASKLRVAVDAALPAPTFSISGTSGGATATPTKIPATATSAHTAVTATNTPRPPTATSTKTAAAGVGVCDGRTDDSAALQDALTKGGIVIVNAGTCIISSPLTYPSNSTLQGAGQDVTTLRNKAGLNGAVMLQPAADRVTRFTVKDLTLDAQATSNEDNKFTINANATSYFLSDHVTYRHVMQMAVWSDGANATATDHLTIQDSRVTEAFGDGFSFFGQITDASILNNEVTGCMDDGIAFQEKVGYWGPQGYPTRITITGNTVHDCVQRNSWGSTANGINIFGSDNVTVSNNRITNVVSDGLRLTGGVNRRATNIHAYGNTVVNSGANYVAGSGVPPWCIHIDQSDWVDGGSNALTAGSTGDVFRNINSTNVTGFPWTST